MIKNLSIKNFKLHKNTNLQLGSLTMLCGQNGVGKSSVIQSLLLLRQTAQKNRLEQGLDLNKPFCYIGTTKDALYEFASKEEGDEIAFVLETAAQNTFSWIFDTNRLESSFLKRINDMADSAGYECLSLFNNNFQYLSAGRSGDYTFDDYAVETEKQLSITEGKGELTAQFLYTYGGMINSKTIRVSPEIAHPSAEFDDLLSQTTAWEREISQGVNIHPQKIGSSYEVRYSYDTKRHSGPTNEYSAKNVGFGLSYALSIIVAILSAAKGSLILIENPEAHLHPYGQSKLAELMCLAAQSGIQIIVETHSDHIINGMLVCCKKEQIEKENIKIFYFDRDEEEDCAKTTEVEVLKGGRIKKAPIGFFDQIGKDLRILMSTNTVNNG